MVEVEVPSAWGQQLLAWWQELLPWGGIVLVLASGWCLRRARKYRWGWFACGVNQVVLWGGYALFTRQPGLFFGVLYLGLTYLWNWTELELRDLWWLVKNAPRLLLRIFHVGRSKRLESTQDGSPSNRLAS
jgi:hypothetical protein